jgi:hypothetical protein
MSRTRPFDPITSITPEFDLMLMHSLARIRAAGYSIMLVFAGLLAVPLTAYAQGDAAAGEKVFAHCAPLPLEQAR